MLRASDQATIEFGMVNIPVKVYSVKDTTKKLSFHYVDQDGDRLRQQYVDKNGEVVERSDRLLGYEYEKGQHVVFTPDEIEALQVKASKRIQLKEFVLPRNIPSHWIDHTNYLGPHQNSVHAFHVFRKALIRTKRAAICLYASRGKQNLCMITPLGDALVFQRLNFAEEVRDVDEIGIPEAKVSPQEIKIAAELVLQHDNPEFCHENYENQAKSNVIAAVEQRMKSGKTHSQPAGAEIPSILESLKQSVGNKK